MTGESTCIFNSEVKAMNFIDKYKLAITLIDHCNCSMMCAVLKYHAID